MLKFRFRIAWLYLAILIIIMLIGYTLVGIVNNLSPASQAKNAWEMAKLSGSYSFRTDIDQRTAPVPNIANYGRPAQHTQLRIEGRTDEATQSAELTLTNITPSGESHMYIRRVHGRTYVMRDDGTWQSTPTDALVGQLSGLTYLAGMKDVRVQGAAGYVFGFDGNAFTDHMQRLLHMDALHGITYNDQTYQAAQSEQLRLSSGNGQLHIDSQGLPKQLALQLLLPQTVRETATNLDIRMEFFGYARTGLELRALWNQPLFVLSRYVGIDASSLRSWLMVALSLAAVLLLVSIIQLFGRRMYLPVTMLVVAMTIYQPFSNIPVTKAATTASNQPTTPAPPLSTPKVFNPLVAPLNQPMGIALPAAGVTSPSNMQVIPAGRLRVVEAGTNTDCSALVEADKTADTDSDGLTNDQECIYGTSLTNADTDSDGLTDLQEIRLGTQPTHQDTDNDGLSDYIEVTAPTIIDGNKYYSSPFVNDTNGDGFSDGVECAERLKSATPTAACYDTDNDKIPNFLDNDDDNDGVPDNTDLTPLNNSTAVYSDANPYGLVINGLPANNKPVTLELQIRPTDAKLLYANNAILDWPGNDKNGRIQRTTDTTFANTTSTDIVTPTGSINPLANDTASQNGDIKVTALLEIQIDISNVSNGDYGNLPVLPCKSTNTCAADQSLRPSWVDTTKLAPYGISVGWSYDTDGISNTNELTLNVPLSTVTDDSGTAVAYDAIMYYANNHAWGTSHKYRLQWLISSLQNQCTDTSAACDDSNRVEKISRVHSYYSDWKLAGITATEQSGVDAAIIYEDTSKSVVNNPTQRRLSIAQITKALQMHYLNTPYLNVTDSNPQKSIAGMFNNNANTNIYGIDGTATKVYTTSYSTDKDFIKILAEVPKLLNANLCATKNQVNCSIVNGVNTPNATAMTACQNDTSVICRPGMIVMNEVRSRRATFDNTTTQLAFSSDIVVGASRMFYGQMFTVSDGQWKAFSQSDLVNEIAIAEANIPAPTAAPDTTLTLSTWQTYFRLFIQSYIASFAQTNIAIFMQGTADALANNPPSNQVASANITWDNEIVQLWRVWGTIIEQSTNEDPPNQTQMDNTGYASNSGSKIVDIIKTVAEFNAEAENKFGVNKETAIAGLGIAVAMASMAISIAQLSGSLTSDEDKLIINNTLGGASLALGLFALYEAVNAYRAVTTVATTASAAATTTATTATAVNAAAKTTTTAAKFAKACAIVGAIIAVAATWVVAGFAIANAKFAYQIVNAVASAIGMTIAIVVLAVISFIPVIGQVIAAVVAVIDGIAAIACANLSTRQLRSTAAQWLCGGITGLLANFFTFSKTSVLVDSDDIYSHYRKIEDNSALQHKIQGYVKDNAFDYTLKVTDHIAKMPFPAAWQAVFYFWQWNDDIRKTSYRYALGTSDVDLRGSFDVGSDFNNWVADNDTIVTDDETYTYTYKKDVNLMVRQPFATTGINQKLPDLYLSKAYKVREQVCFTIPLFLLFFVIPIPVCYLRTHDAKESGLAVYESDSVINDIFPTTMNGFMTMKPGTATGRYTFAWNDTANSIKFPDFVDADNDGLTAATEVDIGSRDDLFDTDGDGISDNREKLLQTSPTTVDTDGDGLNDYQELQYGTDPNKTDTDGDGLRDGEEIVRVECTSVGVNCHRVGGWDVTYFIENRGTPQSNPLVTWVQSDPLNPDADNDGLIDLRERILGTSPFAKNSPDIVGFEDVKIHDALSAQMLLNFEDSTGSRLITTANGTDNAPVSCSNNITVVADTIDSRATNSATFGTGGCVVTNSAPATQFSVAMWVKFATANSAYFFQSNNINLNVGPVPASPRANTVALSSSAVWTHIAVVYDGEFYIIYQNGVETTRYRGSAYSTLGDITIGASGVSLDDVAVFGTALTPSEVLSAKRAVLYQSRKTDMVLRPGDRISTRTTIRNKLLGRNLKGLAFYSVMGSHTPVPNSNLQSFAVAADATTQSETTFLVPGTLLPGTGNSVYAQGCVFSHNQLCLKLDDTVAGTAKSFSDLSANSYSIRCDSADAGSTTCPILSDGAWDFPTNSVARLQLPTSITQELSSHEFSVGMWVKLTAPQIIATRSLLSSTGLRLGLTNNVPSFGAANTLSGGSAITDQTWHHLAYRLQNNRRAIYVDGIQVARDSAAIDAVTLSTANPLYLGADSSNNQAGASIRDVQIYATALTDTQMAAWGRNCDDPLLVTCINPQSETVDASVYGGDQQLGITYASNAYTFTAGYVNLFNNHNFTLLGKFTATDACNNQIVFQATANAGQQLVITYNRKDGFAYNPCRVQVKYANWIEPLSTTLLANHTYVIVLTNQVDQDVKGAIYDDTSSTPSSSFTHAVSLATGNTLTSVVDPITVPAGGLSHVRLYADAIADTTAAAMAGYLLNNQPSTAMQQPPRSDTLTVRSEARAKVIQTDTNFERDPLGSSSDFQLAFDEPALATTFQDVISTTKQFSCVTAPCPQSGVLGVTGNSLLFVNTVAKQYVSSNNAQLDFFNKDLTMDFWIKPLAYGAALVNNQRLEVLVDADGYITLKHAYWEARPNQSTFRWPNTALKSAIPVRLGQWTRVTVNIEKSNQQTDVTESIAINGANLVTRDVASSAYTSQTRTQNSEFLLMNLGYDYHGYIDNVTLSNDMASPSAISSRPLTVAPSWDLRFEDYLSTTSIMTDSKGVTKSVTLGSVILPENNSTRSGIARYQAAASCIGITALPWAACPIVDVVGLAGLATTFNGTNTLLKVANPQSIMDSIKNGGTVQLILNPQNQDSVGTVLAYGDWANDATNGLKVTVGTDSKVTVQIGSNSYTPDTALVPTWNVISFNFGASGFTYYQNGNKETNFTAGSASRTSSVSFSTNASWQMYLGGNPSAAKLTSSASNLFKGGIDDISFFPEALPSYLMFQSARLQSALGMVKKELGSFTVDADAPTAVISNPEYASANGMQFLVDTSDTTSLIDALKVNIVKSTEPSSSVLLTSVPICSEQPVNDPRNVTYCPFESKTVEGRYDLLATTQDAVYNQGVSGPNSIGHGTFFVDTTAPTLTLVRVPTYTTTLQEGTNKQLLTLHIRATDPALRDSGSPSHRGIGVKSVEVNLQSVNGQSVAGWQSATLLSSSLVTATTVITGTWESQFALPAVPNGYYLVQVRSKDALDNAMGFDSQPQYVAGASNPIEVDGAPPHDVIVNPSPLTQNLYIVGPSTLENSTLVGRVSDIYDGRVALQHNLSVKLDFDTVNGAKAFDNRVNTRYVSDCVNCPTVAIDNQLNNQLVARFNIDGNQQFITAHNANNLFNDLFTVAMRIKITDSGTLLSSGNANNPRLRIFAERVTANTFKIKAFRGNTSLSSAIVNANTWYGMIYTESQQVMSMQTGSVDYLNWSDSSIITKSLKLATTPDQGNDLLIGAAQSSTSNNLVEDYFRGYIDDVIISNDYLTANDLVGNSIARGAGTLSHQTRLAVRDDGFADVDGLAALTDFFVPVNQAKLPVVDVMNSRKSVLCNGELTSPVSTCPTITQGFTSNAISFADENQGVWLGYAITQSVNSNITYSLRMRIPTDATSGRMATIGNNLLALSAFVDYNANLGQLTTTISATNGITSVVALEVVDNQWHQLTLVSTADSSNTTLAVYWDDRLIGTTAAASGLFRNAAISVGASYHGRAAKNAMVDDIGLFHTALSLTQIRALAFGYDPVYIETFDEISDNATGTVLDESLFQQPTSYTDVKIGTGMVGAGLLSRQIPQTVIHRDDRGLMVIEPNQPWALSLWLNFANANATGTILQSTTPYTYGYTLGQSGNNLTFSHAGVSIVSNTAVTPNVPTHVVVNSDGFTMTMYMNGTAVGSTAVSSNMRTTPLFKDISSTASASSGTASNANDGNVATVFTTSAENDPWWQADLGSSQQIDRIIIRNRTDGVATNLHNLHVLIADTALGYADADQANWTQYIANQIGAFVVLTLPAGTTGQYVRLQIEGTNETLALSEVTIQRAPVVTITSNVADVDDVRVYRHALTPTNITQLRIMGWQDSTLTPRQDGFEWRKKIDDNIEVDATIQSMTVDQLGNSRANNIGEQTLWSGLIDTMPPRITSNEQPITDTDQYRYTVSIDEHNPNLNLLQTPCGARLDYTTSYPNSLGYRARSSGFDASIMATTHLEGGCVLSNTPDVVKQLTESINATTSMVFGNRYAYVGDINQVNVVDVQNATNLVQSSATVNGTVQELVMSRNKDRLYVVSTTNGADSRATVTIFDIAENSMVLQRRGSVAIQLAANQTVAASALTSSFDGSTHSDHYLLVMLNTATTQQLISVQVGNPDQPTQLTTTALHTLSVDMSASYDVVAVAQGDAGVQIYRVNDDGTMTALIAVQPPGYSNRVIIDDKKLIIINDDEPLSSTAMSPNTMIIVPLIDTIVNTKAQVYQLLETRASYVPVVPTDTEDSTVYRIIDIASYLANDIVMMSRDMSNNTKSRLSIVSTDGITPTLRSDAVINQPNLLRVATNNNNILTLATDSRTARLTAFVVSDRRLATQLCDQAGNCNLGTASTVDPLPAPNNISIVNLTNAYTMTTPLVTFHAEAPTGVRQINTQIDNRVPNQVWTQATSTGLPKVEETYVFPAMTQGKHTIRAINTYNNTLSAVAEYYAPITTTLPLADVMHPLQKSLACTPNCPTISANTLTFTQTNTIDINHNISQVDGTAKLLSMQLKIPASAPSGRIVSVLPTAATALAFWFDYDASTQEIVATVRDAITTTARFRWPDDQFHQLTVVANAMNGVTTFNLYLDDSQQEALSGSTGSRFTTAKVIFGAKSGSSTNAVVGMVIDEIALLSSAVAVDETIDYRTSVSDSTFPLIDEIFDKKSSCTTCPTIANGTLTFPSNNNGINLGYRLTQLPSTAKSISMRLMVASATVTGRVATLQSSDSSALRLGIVYDQSTNKLIATAAANGSTQSVTTTTTMVADTWATLNILAQATDSTTTFEFSLDGVAFGKIVLPGQFTNAALSLGAVATATAATRMTIDDISVSNPAIANNETVAVNQIIALMSGDVITPQTIITPVYDFFVDSGNPQIQLIDTVVGLNRVIDGMAVATMVITDVSDLVDLQITNTNTNSQIPFSIQQNNNNQTSVKIFYPQAMLNADLLPLKIVTTDSAQHTTTFVGSVIIDNDAPVLQGGVVNAKINGVKTALSNNATITRTNDLDLHVAWSSLTDRVAVALTQFEYTKQTITNTIFVSTTQITGMRAPAIDAPEGSRIVPSMRLRDTMGNEGVVTLPTVYVDSAVTPDYTQISSNANDVYRGWLQNGCAAMGVNADQTQRFATTWDANALRLNWQGSDWNIDGDLFVYLDTVAGGTITPYIPSKFDRVLSDKIATGDAFVTLPIDMAGRTSAAGTLGLFMNKWQQQFRDVLHTGRSSSAVEGADYVIYMGRNDTIAVLRWDSVSSAWVAVNESPSMKYSVVNNIKQTDIRVLFRTIGYTVGNPVGMMAFASKENYLLPWATFPINNPTKNSLGTNKITITPLLNGYSWASLGSGVCPRTAARNPDTTQVLASLASNPSGVSTRAVNDVFANTQPDAIAEAIDQTSDMCAQLATDPWCKTVSQLADTAAAGAALIPQLTNDLVTQQAPVVGRNSLITYTLQLQNQSNKPTKRIYGIVRTYGGIWLTGTINPNATNGVYDGGRYDYHTVTVPEYADFQVLKIESIPANSSRSINVTAKIDPLKAQSSNFDRRNTSNVAKIDVRLVDTAAITSTNSLAWLTTGRTIEWVNAGLRIDTEAPRQMKPDNQLVVGAGNVRLTGSVTDDSAVPVVMLEYTSNLSPSVIGVNCGAAVTGRWSCPIVVPRSAATINYRVRGSDKYGQMNAWSAWYRSSVDRDKPTFVLDTISNSALNATYVGGSTINLSGVLTDSTTTAAIQFCDEQQADCRTIVPSDGALTQTSSYTTSVAGPVTAITAQPCNATAFDAYTVYPITVTNVADGRVDTVTVNTTLAHAAAQDIDLWLQSPSGTRVALLTSTRTATTNVRATFDDTAIRTTTSISGTTALSDAYTIVRPDGVLSTFTGEAASGTWRLLACDRNTDGVTGSINNAQITIATRSAARHQQADWNLTLANTAGQDNVARTIQFWSVDGVGNVSNARIAVMQIDTVAPTLDVTQNDTVVFPSGSANTFQGTTSDGGTLRSLRANVYDTNSLVTTIDLIPVQMSSSELQRINYLQNRAIRYYTWTLPASELSSLASGTYTVQFVASDVIGNQRTSLPATFMIPTKTAPAFNDVQVINSAIVNSQTIRTHIDTGYSDTTISAQVALDNDANVYTDTTTVKGWQYNGSTDTVLQGAIPSTIQTIPITKLEMNNDVAAALDQSGTLRTWAVDGRADHISTANQIAGLTPINNLVQFSIAEQLMWDNYLLTLDKNGAVREYRQPDGVASVVDNPVVIRNRANQLITDNIVAIDAGYHHTLVLLRSGQVITCSHTTATCKDEAANSTAVFKSTPATAQYGVTQIQAGIDFSVVLRSDRKVVAWGDSSYNHLAIPPGIKPVTQIAVGGDHTLALQDDGTVVAWGDNSQGQSTVPNGLTDVVYVAAGANSSAAVTRNGRVVIWGENTFTMTAPNCCASAIAMNYAYRDNQNNQVTAQTITVHKTGVQTMSAVINAATFPLRYDVRFSGLIPGRRYRYTLTLTNTQGTQTYNGVFVNNLVFNKIFTPLLLNSSPAILPLVKGK